MGCGGSTSNSLESPTRTGKGSIFKRQPKVSITVGNRAKILDSMPRVIFLFGGPGTKKGKIVDNLANVFGFEVINMENLIIQNLTRKLEEPNPNQTIQQIQQMLKKEKELLKLAEVLKMLVRRLESVDKHKFCIVDFMPNLKWMLSNPTFIKECMNKLSKEQELLKLAEVLKMLVRRLESVDKHKFCIVDFMPNLKWMLSNPTFIKECMNDLRIFEEKFPISFAIHFLIPKEKVLNKLETECAKHPGATPPSQTKSADSGAKSDEADLGRTQRRMALYENSVKHFMEYFNKTDKMVTVDVSCGRPDIIWCKICNFFTDFDFPACKTPETVIIFGFDSKELEEMHIEQYSVTSINLQEIVVDANDPVEKLLDQLCAYIDNCDPTRRVFAVDGSGTTLNKSVTNKKPKKILFQEEGDSVQINRYCSVSIVENVARAGMHAVASLENEVCLFLNTVPMDLCKYICAAMTEVRAHRHKR